MNWFRFSRIKKTLLIYFTSLLFFAISAYIFSLDSRHSWNEEPAFVLNPIQRSSHHLPPSVTSHQPDVLDITVRKLSLPVHLPSELEYAMNDLKDTSMGQAALVFQIFGEKTGGTFVECGAYDGETRSNTYFFERYLNWTGVLIEGSPSNFQKLLTKHRKSYAVQACLSPKLYPIDVLFRESFNTGRIVKALSTNESRERDVISNKRMALVTCYPLHAILQTLNIARVDYFSLDVEGDELSVLKTIPYDRIDIRVISVEYIHVTGGKQSIESFMKTKGFFVYGEVSHYKGLAWDLLLVQHGVIPEPAEKIVVTTSFSDPRILKLKFAGGKVTTGYH